MKKERKKSESRSQLNGIGKTSLMTAGRGSIESLVSRSLVVNETRCENCPAFNFCQKKVLMVGGIDRMERRYRELVETCGGTFEHHNGTMKKGTQKLKNSMLRADVVLCPVRNNSHAACQQVKKLGKKFNKPVYLLSNFSLNAVSQVINPSGQGTGQCS